MVILPKLPGKQTAKLRATVKRLTESAEKGEWSERVEYGKALVISNNALGFWVAMNASKDAGGVGKVQWFIAGRQISNNELIDKHKQMLDGFKLGGRIPKYLSENTKRHMRSQPGLPT